MPVSLTCRTVPAFPVRQAGRLPHHNVSRPAQRSLALRPAWLLSRPWRPVPSECFNRGRYLPQPLRLLPAGATVAGRDSHPLGKGAFHGALSQSCWQRGLIAHSNKAVRRAKRADPLDPGQVGGSGHWFDTVRGVLVLNRKQDGTEGRMLACTKANRGPDRLVLPLDPIHGDQGQPLGLNAADRDGWRTPPPSDERRSSPANGHRRHAGRKGSFSPGVD